MTRTGFDPKISYVDREDRERTENPQSSQGDRPSDSKFVRVEKKDEWKALTESDSELGDIMNVMNGIKDQSQSKGPIDDIMEGMIFTDPYRTHFLKKQIDIPEVPELNDLFKTHAASLDNMGPVVKSYEALRATIEELIYCKREAFKYACGNDAELLQLEIDELNKTLYKANIEYDKAQYWRSVELYNDRLDTD